jgi:hypothetical protein
MLILPRRVAILTPTLSLLWIPKVSKAELPTQLLQSSRGSDLSSLIELSREPNPPHNSHQQGQVTPVPLSYGRNSRQHSTIEVCQSA